MNANAYLSIYPMKTVIVLFALLLFQMPAIASRTTVWTGKRTPTAKQDHKIDSWLSENKRRIARSFSDELSLKGKTLSTSFIVKFDHDGKIRSVKSVEAPMGGEYIELISKLIKNSGPLKPPLEIISSRKLEVRVFQFPDFQLSIRK